MAEVGCRDTRSTAHLLASGNASANHPLLNSLKALLPDDANVIRTSIALGPSVNVIRYVRAQLRCPESGAATGVGQALTGSGAGLGTTLGGRNFV